MCGIVGYVGKRRAKSILLDGLKRLEYRGYDSVGVAAIEEGKLWVHKRAGKVAELEAALKDKELSATCSIGHSRWATHGPPTDENAHPHFDCRRNIALVHNGIIENYLPLKEELLKKGHEFTSQTDTEVLAHLFEEHYRGNLEEAVRASLQGIQGAFAIAVIAKDSPDEIVAAKTASPLVIGVGKGENFLASDITALLPYTRKILILHDWEMAVIKKDSVKITDLQGRVVQREPQQINWDVITAQKQGYKHFMLKEIHEQPQAVANTLQGRFSLEEGQILLKELEEAQIEHIENIYLVACGTAYYACLTAKYLWQRFLDLPIGVELASEFRYSNPHMSNKTLVIAVSQSGETADTLAAVRLARSRGAQIIAIPNVMGSSITREADYTVYTHAGPEIGVASTKAFTSQLAALSLLGLYLGRKRGALSEEDTKKALKNLIRAPVLIEATLSLEPEVEKLARTFYNKANFLYLGRNILYPIALEGALKLKEISYIHAEGYAAGEMKHGPIALIDENMPLVVLITKNSVYDKVFSNIEEVKARKGIVIAVTDELNKEIQRIADYILEVPAASELLTPMLFVVPLQLLAYHVGVLRGTDVDQPRNLAKSVTVE